VHFPPRWRLTETLRPHLKDVDFSRRGITDREGEGGMDRELMAPLRWSIPLFGGG
jgi:hypothetical protein